MDFLFGDGTTYHFWTVVLVMIFIIAGAVKIVPQHFFHCQPEVLGCGDPSHSGEGAQSEKSDQIEPKRTSKITNAPSLWLVVPIAFGILYVCGILYYQRGTQKMVMPGIYEVNLDNKGYGVFNFWQWPSKGINEIPDEAHISIFDSKGMAVRPSEWPPPRRLQSRSFNNVGREEYQVQIPRSGRYTIVCEDRRVVLIVPFDHYDEPMSNETVTGTGDDFNFAQAAALGKQAAEKFVASHEPVDKLSDLVGKRVTLRGSMDNIICQQEFKPGLGNKPIYLEPLNNVQESGRVRFFINAGVVEKIAGARTMQNPDEEKKLLDTFNDALTGHDRKHILVSGRLCRRDVTAVNGSRTRREMDEGGAYPILPLNRYFMPLEEVEVFSTTEPRLRLWPR